MTRELADEGGSRMTGEATQASTAFGALRPETLDAFIGQDTMCDNLRVFMNAARARGEPLDHVLFAGPPGLGKTTLARLIAKEMQADITTTSGTALQRAGDVAAQLTALEPGETLFIDEIHRMAPAAEETLYPAMEDFVLDIIVGAGAGARSVRVPLAPFTLVGATTRAGLLSPPLRERFGITFRMLHYPPEDLARMAHGWAAAMGISLTADGAQAIAARGRGAPRAAQRLLRRVRDFVESGAVDAKGAEAAFARLGVDSRGLDALDRRYLATLTGLFAGGPAGLDALASALAETRDVVEDVIEPHLIRQGLTRRTARGRVATFAAWEALNQTPPAHLGWQASDINEEDAPC